jgi:hypothetical protein
VCWSDESLGSMTLVSSRAPGVISMFRLGPCRHGEGYGQHPVLIGGGDVVGVDVLTEGQATQVTAGEALGTQPLHVVFGASQWPGSARSNLSPATPERSGVATTARTRVVRTVVGSRCETAAPSLPHTRRSCADDRMRHGWRSHCGVTSKTPFTQPIGTSDTAE